MNKKLKDLLDKSSQLKNKRIIIAIIISMILLVSLVSYLIIFSNSNSEKCILSGTIYIDDEPAPYGTNVTIVFSNGVVLENYGVNETGVYEIDISDFIGESFIVHIENGGNIYVGTDEMGNKINISILESDELFLDVFIKTSFFPGDDDDDDNTGDDDDDDNTGDDDDDDNTGDDDDDNPTDDEGENNSSYLFIEKTLWSDIDAEWKNNESVEIGGNVQFNITVRYNGSNLSEINVLDILPDGLEYINNASINGNIVEPVVNQTANSLSWNLSAISDENITLFINYNTTILKRSTLQNNVTVNIIKNNTNINVKHSNAEVYVFGDLIVSKTVKNLTDSNWNETTIVEVNDTVRFNISIQYNGSYSISNLTIIEKLPISLIYIGNTTINGINETITTIVDNQTIIWNISNFKANEILWIEFDVNVTESGTIINTINVKGNESLGKNFSKFDSASIDVVKQKKFICEKTVRILNNSWEKSINALVGDIVNYNVTIKNIEMSTVYGLTVIDTMPLSLRYIENSTVITFKNQTYYQEPTFDNETNSLYWIDLNNLIEGYFLPNEFITIKYNVSILGNGILINTVNVNSSLCGSCNPLTGTDSATINATTPIPELSVEIIIPEHVYIGEFAEINTNVVGGNLPYLYKWDTDNDSVYDDENKSSINIKWDSIGTYPLSVRVTDNSSENCTDSVEINVTIEPLYVNAGGPYYANQNELIQFNGSASGGIGNYTWFWDFNDGNVSTIQNPSHAFSQVKTYYVNLSVSDERNVTLNDTALVYISSPDNKPPVITIESPINAIYYNNKAIFPFFRPFILGSIEINITAKDNDSTINKIELYINNLLVHSTTSSIMSYNWDEQIFGKQTISIKAFDSNGNQQFIEKNVWKFF